MWLAQYISVDGEHTELVTPLGGAIGKVITNFPAKF